jgi:NDP-sugar pyrophosphorylase family protein
MSNLEAIILVGGKGTRLRSVVNDRPKPMANVLGKPFLEWIVWYLQKQGIGRIIMATGYKGEMVKAHFGDGSAWGVEIVYSQEQTPLGTGGAARQAVDLATTPNVLLLNGDSFCLFDTAQFLQVHHDNQADATIWLIEMSDCQRYGRVEVNPDRRVKAFHEKSSIKAPGYINAGVYIFSHTYMKELPRGESFSLEMQIFPSLVEAGLFSIIGSEPFLDIGTPASFELVERFIRSTFIKESVSFG